MPPFVAIWGTKALGIAAKVLTFGITLPVWAFLAAAAWAHVDKGSAVRTAVDDAVTELVAGAEIRALESQVAGMRRLKDFAEGQRDEARRIQAVTEKNARRFADELVLSELQKETDDKEIAELQAQPRDPGCEPDPSYIDSLRNR